MAFFAIVVILLFSNCSQEDDLSTPNASSLKIVHGISNAPGLHLDYFGDDLESFNFSSNPTLDYGSSRRISLPSDEARNLNVTFENDTTSIVFSEEISLDIGEMRTFFLVGNGNNIRSESIADVGHKRMTDSLNAVRFVNMSEDIDVLSVGITGVDLDNTIAGDISFGESTDFIEVDATLENESYTFNFEDQSGNILASVLFRQYVVFRFGSNVFVSVQALRDNVTFALIGKIDDGQGNNTLQIVQINNF